MDAKNLYRLIKPHLEKMDHSEKKSFSRLISKNRPEKISRHHRKILPLQKAKENLKMVCQREMERERQEQRSL